MTALEHAPSATRTHGVSWDSARQLAYEAPTPLAASRVALRGAAGLTLAEDVCARTPLPAFATSAMDGYAVAGNGPHRIVGEVRAGRPWSRELLVGEAVAISTGAQVPTGASAVLRIELAAVAGDLLAGPALEPGTHIRPAGEDAMAGQCLVAAGNVVRPEVLGLAAACGYDELLVRPRPQVTVVVTGDELVQTGRSGAGLVRDSLGPMLPSLVSGLGGDATEVRHVSDRPGELQAAITSAGRDSVVVVTGSTSVGSTDQLRSVIRDHGARWVVDTVDCRPGHPMLMAGLGDNRWLVGLPGNPFAALVGAHTVLGPLLDGLSGRLATGLPTAVVTGDVGDLKHGTCLVPVTWDGSGVRVLGGHRPASLQGAALGDALAVLGPGWISGEPARLMVTG